MKIIKRFFPNSRWFTGLTMLIFIYIGYATVGPLVETTMPALFKPLIPNVWGHEIIDNVGTNFWFGTVLMFCGFLLYLIMSGVPGTEVERYEQI